MKSNTLRSPGYPRSYPNNIDCVDRVHIPFNQELIVYFKYFQLELERNCRYTKLQLVCSELLLRDSFHSAANCLPLLLLIHVLFLFRVFFPDRYDYLRITDDRRNTIGTYCGYRTGQRVRVVATVAVLTFHSDSSVRYRGFELIFSFSLRECRIVYTFRKVFIYIYIYIYIYITADSTVSAFWASSVQC